MKTKTLCILCAKCGKPWPAESSQDVMSKTEYEEFWNGKNCPACRNGIGGVKADLIVIDDHKLAD